MQKNNNTSKVVKGLIWTFGERITAQLVTTLVTIVLARLLDPEHYGIISIVTVFITICNVFVTSGFGTALVQKKEVDENDYNTAFVLSFSLSLILYILLFFVSPLIADFYNMNQLTVVIRVLALRLPIASINTIQQASIQRNMQFKKFFISTLFGTVISGVIGIFLAYRKCGVWALVAQYLSNVFVDTIVLTFVGTWKPKFIMKKDRINYIVSFGSRVLATNLVFTLENDIKSLVIGKSFGTSDLAYYDQGKKYPLLLVTNVNTAITKVMLPTYSKSQDDLGNLKRMLRKSIRVGIYVLMPILLGFAAVAPSFTSALLTEKWLPAVPFMQIFAISCITRPFETACHQALLAVGKSALILRLMVITSIVSILTLLVAVFCFKSVMMVAILNLLCAVLSFTVFSWASARYLNYKLLEQLSDILPECMVTLVMAAAVYGLGFLSLNIYFLLVFQIVIGGLMYILMSMLFKLEPYKEVISILKK